MSPEISRRKFFSHSMQVFCLAFILFSAVGAMGQVNVMVSPAGGALPAGVSPIGGIVIDLVGVNGKRIVGELSAGQLFQGWAVTTDTVIGTATGFTSTLMGAMGGGFSAAALRVTLYDGDSATGNFDFQMDTLLGNGISFGDFSNVPTVETNALGSTVISNNAAGGFRNNILDTGFFQLTGSSSLRSLYNSLFTSGSLQLTFHDLTPNDNLLDFTRGVDPSYANVGHIPGLGAPTQVLQNSASINTPTSLDYVAQGLTITGSNGQSNTINSVIFAPGSSLVISSTLTIVSGSIQSQTGGTSTISGGVLTGPYGLAFDLAGDQQVSSVIAGSMIVAKTGVATLTLTGSNTYTGVTVVSGGTLQVGNGTTGSINASSLIDVDLGAVLVFNMADKAVHTAPINNNGVIQFSGTHTNTIAGEIFGWGDVYQVGSGNTILSGSNSYTGATTVTSGTLQIGDGTNGTIDPSSLLVVQPGATLILNSPDARLWSHSIANDGALVLQEAPFSSYLYTAAVSGSGSLTKTGTNTLLLSGSNSYSGGTIVMGGTMQIGSAYALPVNTAMQVNAGAALDVSAVSPTLGSLIGGGTVITGPLTQLAVGSSDTDTVFAGVVQGTGAFQKVGTGTLTLSGTNTYSGSTRVSAGTLQIGNGSTGSISNTSSVTIDAAGALAFNMGDGAEFTVDIVNNGTLQANGANVNFLSGVISGSGSLSQVGSGITILTGVNTYTGATTVTNGSLFIGDGKSGTIDSSSTISVQSGGMLFLDSPDASLLSHAIANNGAVVLMETAFNTTYTFSGAISGMGAFLKDSANTLILSGSNSYSGATIVEQGTLMIGSSNAIPSQSALVVNKGALLDLNGYSPSVGSLSGGGALSTATNTVLTVGSDNSNTTFSGSISGAGDVHKVGGGVWSVTGANAYTGDTRILGGTVLVNGSLQGNVFVTSGILGGSGIIRGNVSNQALVSPGNSPGKLTILGNYTQLPSGSLLIQLASPSSYDQLVIGGTAILSGTLQVSNAPGNKLRGTAYTIITAAGGVSGVFADISSASLLALNVIYGADSVTLQSKYRIFGNVPGLTPNEKAVATAMDQMLDSNAFSKNTHILQVIDSVNGLATQEIPAALECIVPTDYVILPDASFALAQVQASNLERRMEDIRSALVDYTANVSAPSTFYTTDANRCRDGVRYIAADGRELAPAPMERRLSFFLNGSGESVSDKSSLIDGNSKFDTGGISTGADYRFNDHFAAGATLGYANTTTTGREKGTVGIDGGNLSAYATAFNEGFFANGILGGGFSNYDLRRASLGGLAKGTTTGVNFNALLGGGYSYSSGGFSGGPIASLRYCSVQIDHFSESGSLAPLDIARQDKSSMKSTAGFQVAYEIPAGSVIVKPQAKLQWKHEFANDARDIVANFQSGSSFTVNGPALGTDSVLLDLGLTVQISPAVGVYGCYSGDIGATNYTSNTFFGGVQLSF